MEEIRFLELNGFSFDEEEEAYVRGIWNIRLYENAIEVFDNGDVGKYYIGDRTLECITEVIEDIDSL